MAEHVSVDREGEAGALADALNQPIDGVGRERSAALGGEDEGLVRRLPPQLPQRSDLVAGERTGARLAFYRLIAVMQGISRGHCLCSRRV